MYIHRIIKIMYVNMGFLPDIPYHLISDFEMFDAFLRDDGFFATYYYCPGEEFQEAYDKLIGYISDRISKFQNGEIESLPAWIYSYMIMRPVTYQSDPADIDYICDMSNIEQPAMVAVFTPEVAATCYEVSSKWLKKMPYKTDDRPPTMFGETHVTKSLRLMQANVLLDSDFGVNN